MCHSLLQLKEKMILILKKHLFGLDLLIHIVKKAISILTNVFLFLIFNLKHFARKVKINSKASADEWIIANVKHAGFYRVNYDQKGWKLLIDQLKANHTLIDSTSRAQLIDDSFNLGRAELIDQLVYLDVTSYLINEEDPLAFQAALSGLEYLYDMLSSDFETIELYKVNFFKNNLFCF